MEKPTKWLRLDGDDGWQIVMPESDIEPHSIQQEGHKRELAWFTCPCKPDIDYTNKIIVHSSFEYKKKVDESMTVLFD